MLKYEIDKLDAVEEPFRPMYEEKGGKFVLKVEGIPAPKQDDGLAERLAKLEKNNAELLAEKKKAKEAADAAILEAAKKGGDVEALEKSWQAKLKAREDELAGEVGQYKQMVTGLTVGATAATFAAEVFGDHAELMMPHVNKRLTTEIVEGQARVRVLDAQGKPSAMTVDELKSEFRNNAKFASFVVASKASGGGARGTGGGGEVATMPRKQFEAMTPAQKVELSKKGIKLTD